MPVRLWISTPCLILHKITMPFLSVFKENNFNSRKKMKEYEGMQKKKKKETSPEKGIWTK